MYAELTASAGPEPPPSNVPKEGSVPLNEEFTSPIRTSSKSVQALTVSNAKQIVNNL
ncbi:hypothetical protein N9R11_04830 [Polaribacter sp.]|nr:hypothetical protein [Polaribacter sp.]